MRLFLLCGAALGSAYLVSPYLSLYWMGQALRAGNVRALTAEVDWDRVRSGLKQDIEDGITGQPQAQLASQNSDDLPPFGSGMVVGMATSIVDQAVTPQHLAQTVGALRQAGARDHAIIVAAYFTSPTHFTVAFRTAEEKPDEAPIQLGLRLEAAGWSATWKVVHASVPASVLTRFDGSAS